MGVGARAHEGDGRALKRGRRRRKVEGLIVRELLGRVMSHGVLGVRKLR
jgi:hypothetical protein